MGDARPGRALVLAAMAGSQPVFAIAADVVLNTVSVAEAAATSAACRPLSLPPWSAATVAAVPAAVGVSVACRRACCCRRGGHRGRPPLSMCFVSAP